MDSDSSWDELSDQEHHQDLDCDREQVMSEFEDLDDDDEDVPSKMTETAHLHITLDPVTSFNQDGIFNTWLPSSMHEDAISPDAISPESQEVVPTIDPTVYESVEDSVFDPYLHHADVCDISHMSPMQASPDPNSRGSRTTRVRDASERWCSISFALLQFSAMSLAALYSYVRPDMVLPDLSFA